MNSTIAAVVGVVFVTTGWAAQCLAQGKVPRVGYLEVGGAPQLRQAWLQPLAERGWTAGTNFTLVVRSSRSDATGFTDAARELVDLPVDVILASSASALHAARAATTSIPIVAWDYTTDPIAAGYVQNYARPGTNVTGIFLDAPELAGKWLEILRSLVPGLSRVAVVFDPRPGRVHLEGVERAAKKFGIRLQIYEVRSPDDIEQAFAAFRGRPQALVILPSPLTAVQSPRLAELAMKHRLPATAIFAEFSAAGGSTSYGPDRSEVGQRYAAQIAKVLGGAKPGDIPIERPTKFQFLLNMKTIKALGLKVPDTLLLGAEQVDPVSPTSPGTR